MPTEQIYLVPFTAGILFMAIPLTTYTISIHLGHLYPLFPYISDTGSFPPESCVFSQLANMLAALIFVVAWIRHEQSASVLEASPGYSTGCLRTLNRVSFWTGVVGALGASFIANFQIVNQVPMHATGVVLGVGGINVYIVQQTIMAIRLPSDHAAKYVPPLRLALCLIITAANSIFAVFFAMSYITFTPNETLVNWRPENPGFSLHLASTFAEWISDFAVGTFFLTLAQEFHCLGVAGPTVARRMVATATTDATCTIVFCARTDAEDSIDAHPDELLGLTSGPQRTDDR